uniref:hypothetical protein n=1 Tax=Sulfurospirillum sp. UBA5727 TaxID=1947597 RepID=UPI00260117D9
IAKRNSSFIFNMLSFSISPPPFLWRECISLNQTVKEKSLSISPSRFQVETLSEISGNMFVKQVET